MNDNDEPVFEVSDGEILTVFHRDRKEGGINLDDVYEVSGCKYPALCIKSTKGACPSFPKGGMTSD